MDHAGSARFADRRSAGRELAKAVRALDLRDALVLALPRGGVPVAYEVAQAIDAPLDLMLVRKIGAPDQPEYGVGALTDGANPRTHLNRRLIDYLDISEAYLQREIERQTLELERRRRAYLGTKQPGNPEGKAVVLVDDGIATGGTVRVALEALQDSKPEVIVLAVPVAPIHVLDSLKSLANDAICLSSPDPFIAVGNHYANFDQTTDAEVVELLRGAYGRAA
jgi:putative phosphoribosyl transferase